MNYLPGIELCKNNKSFWLSESTLTVSEQSPYTKTVLLIQTTNFGFRVTQFIHFHSPRLRKVAVEPNLCMPQIHGEFNKAVIS